MDNLDNAVIKKNIHSVDGPALLASSNDSSSPGTLANSLCDASMFIRDFISYPVSRLSLVLNFSCKMYSSHHRGLPISEKKEDINVIW